jgi:hypothetical protein
MTLEVSQVVQFFPQERVHEVEVLLLGHTVMYSHFHPSLTLNILQFCNSGGKLNPVAGSCFAAQAATSSRIKNLIKTP